MKHQGYAATTDKIMRNVRTKESKTVTPVLSTGLHRYAVALAVVTFFLIFVGGLVTSTGSAMSVPTWPLAFGKLIPQLKGGVRFEYGHRVLAGIVSLMTIGLALWAWLGEPRRWVRWLATGAVAMVLVQAVLGGLTVLFDLPLWLAVSHAGTAQAFFCLTVALAMITNPTWERPARVSAGMERPRVTTLAAVTTGVIYGQVLIGAVMRHLGAGLAIPDFPLNFGHLIPPLDSPDVAINFAHRLGAIVVSIFVIWTVVEVMRSYRDIGALRRPALGMIVLLALQITLGAITVLSRRAVIPTTSHVAVGAGLLATSLFLTIRAYHVVDAHAVAPAAAAVNA